VLSEGQLALLAQHGEERRAGVGDVLFRVGDRRYPLIAIIEGEAAGAPLRGYRWPRIGGPCLFLSVAPEGPHAAVLQLGPDLVSPLPKRLARVVNQPVELRTLPRLLPRSPRRRSRRRRATPLTDA
jgi:hypothetical protein